MASRFFSLVWVSQIGNGQFGIDSIVGRAPAVTGCRIYKATTRRQCGLKGGVGRQFIQVEEMEMSTDKPASREIP